MKYLISYTVSHVLFYIGDKLIWFDDWRTDSKGSCLIELANWFLHQSSVVQDWGGGGPWNDVEPEDDFSFDD